MTKLSDRPLPIHDSDRGILFPIIEDPDPDELPDGEPWEINLDLGGESSDPNHPSDEVHRD